MFIDQSECLHCLRPSPHNASVTQEFYFLSVLRQRSGKTENRSDFKNKNLICTFKIKLYKSVLFKVICQHDKAHKHSAYHYCPFFFTMGTKGLILEVQKHDIIHYTKHTCYNDSVRKERVWDLIDGQERTERNKLFCTGGG